LKQQPSLEIRRRYNYSQESLPDGVSPSPPGTPFSQYYALKSIHFKGKADPQAIFGAAINGDVDILQVALHPPSKTVNSIAGSGGDMVRGLGYALIHEESGVHTQYVGFLFSSLLHYADNWPVYQKLAPFAPEEAKELFKVGKYADYGRLDIAQALLDAGAPYK
jgi:ABC-type transport system substrate-binding protein